jgi:hypothetical protein
MLVLELFSINLSAKPKNKNIKKNRKNKTTV